MHCLSTLLDQLALAMPQTLDPVTLHRSHHQRILFCPCPRHRLPTRQYTYHRIGTRCPSHISCPLSMHRHSAHWFCKCKCRCRAHGRPSSRLS
eukprot:12124_6